MPDKEEKVDHCRWNGKDHWGNLVKPTQSFAVGTLNHEERFDAYMVPLLGEGSVLWALVVDVRWNEKHLRGMEPGKHAGSTVHSPYIWIIECRDAEAAFGCGHRILHEKFFVREYAKKP